VFRNPFIQAIGLGAFVYLIFRASVWILLGIAGIMSGLAGWLGYSLVPWSEEVAIAIGVIYVLVAALFSSRSS
jgi:hypothetical protein